MPTAASQMAMKSIMCVSGKFCFTQNAREDSESKDNQSGLWRTTIKLVPHRLSDRAKLERRKSRIPFSDVCLGLFMTFYAPPRFPSQPSQGDRSRPSTSDSGLIIGLYRTRREASNGSGKSRPGPGNTGIVSSVDGTPPNQFGSTPRCRQSSASTPPGSLVISSNMIVKNCSPEKTLCHLLTLDR